MSQLSLQIKKKSTKKSAIYIWILFLGLNVLMMIDELEYVGRTLFLVLFIARLAQIVVASYSIALTSLDKKISNEFLSLYIVFLIAVGACVSLFEPSEMILRLSMNAFFYLLLAATYQGALRDWLQIYLPVSSFLLFAPLGLRAESFNSMQNLPLVFTSFVCSNAIVFVRRYFQIRSSEQITLLDTDTDKEPGDKLGEEEIIFRTEAEQTRAQEFFSIETINCRELTNFVSAIVLQKKSHFKDLEKAQISFSVPREIPSGWGIKAEKSELKLILSQLIDESVASLGMQTGVVRISLQFTFRQMFLIVEDNGRGLVRENRLSNNQESSNQEKSLTPLEMKSLVKFWGADFEIAMKLGVGRRAFMSFRLHALVNDEEIKAYPPFHQAQASLLH